MNASQNPAVWRLQSSSGGVVDRGAAMKSWAVILEAIGVKVRGVASVKNIDRSPRLRA